MKNSVRMADIAKQLGISTVSVSKALAGKPGVSEAMRARVIDLAREMGYTGVSGRYDSGLTGNIGVLISNRLFAENAFYSELYRELVLQSEKEDFFCIIDIISPEAERAAAIPPVVAHRRADGIILMGEFSTDYLTSMACTGLPCLALDFRPPGNQIESIRRDNEEGGRLLTEHLLSAGYKQVGFVGGIHQSSNIMERYLGYQWALLQAGITPRVEWLWDVQHSDTDLPCAADEMPKAFVCSSNESAFYLVNMWQSMMRQDAPKPAIVCFDDFRIPVCFCPQMTTYTVSAKRMAEIAVQQLTKKIRSETISSAGCVIPGQLCTLEQSRYHLEASAGQSV